jgi:hypothetical protein|tara:strand:- start:1177 stop:1326 length:150 start_codon:yes stop_codon:yes gene_type:complete
MDIFGRFVLVLPETPIVIKEMIRKIVIVIITDQETGKEAKEDNNCLPCS